MSSNQEDLGISTRMTNKLPRLPPPEFLAYQPPPGLIRLEQAENCLLRPRLLEICKDSINRDLTEESFSYPAGFGGEPKLRQGLAAFFNSYYNPSLLVEEDHISVSAGSGSAFDALLCTICEEGDIIMTLAPSWSGFNLYASFHASVTILPVSSPKFCESLNPDCVDRLIATYDKCTTQSRIKALLVCNPHNPADDTYFPETLRQLMDFCHEKNLHYISDEVGSLSTFNTDPKRPFASALSLVNREQGQGINLSRVHVLWSASKDFGSPGMRIGCLVSQANKSVLAGVTFSSFWQVSVLSSLFLTAVLTSPQLPDLIEYNRKGLRNSYELLTSNLREWKVDYIPVRAGTMIFVKIAEDAKAPQDEAAALTELKEEGLLISPGRGYLGAYGELGWGRMSFAVKREVMVEALTIMKRVLRPALVIES